MALTAAQLLNATQTQETILGGMFGLAVANGALVTVWQPGYPTETAFSATAGILAPVTERLDFLADSSFRSTAEDEWLDLVILEQVGLPRFAASFATTTIFITNSGGGLFSYEAGAFVALNTAKEKTYKSLTAVVIAPLASSVPVEVVANEAGSASNALPGEIDALETPNPDLTISQPNAALADDAEQDQPYRDRADARVGFLPLSSATWTPGGIKTAWESIAKSGLDGQGVLREDGTRISVTRVRVDGSAPLITVTLADEDGPLAAADLDLVNAALQVYAAYIGVTVVTQNAVLVTQTVEYTLFVSATTTATDAEIIDFANAALFAYVSTVPIGGVVLPPATVGILPFNQIEAALVCPNLVYAAVSVDVTDPTGDVVYGSPIEVIGVTIPAAPAIVRLT